MFNCADCGYSVSVKSDYLDGEVFAPQSRFAVYPDSDPAMESMIVHHSTNVSGHAEFVSKKFTILVSSSGVVRVYNR